MCITECNMMVHYQVKVDGLNCVVHGEKDFFFYFRLSLFKCKIIKILLISMCIRYLFVVT